MKVNDLPLHQLREAVWNPNRMDGTMLSRLRESVRRFGLMSNLAVRPLAGECYEVLSGNQRLQVLRELGFTEAPCVVVHLDDVSSRLLAQVLNRVQGEDDLGLKAELIQEVLREVPQQEVLRLIPETAETLSALSCLDQQDLASYLENWQRSQGARLKHMNFQLLPSQQEVVEEALSRFLPQARGDSTGNPNARGTALYVLCKSYLELTGRAA
jgi:ParB family chromosome partitioning protein